MLRVAVVGSFLLLCDVPLFKYTTIYSLVDVYLFFVVANFGHNP